MNIWGKITKEVLFLLSCFSVCLLIVIYCEWYIHYIWEIDNKNVSLDYFSLYEWNYNKVNEDIITARVFGNDENNNHSYIYVRKVVNNIEIYVSLYDENYLVKGNYNIYFNEEYFNTSFVRDNVLRFKNEESLYKILTSVDSFDIIICSKKKELGKYKFKVNKKLNFK